MCAYLVAYRSVLGKVTPLGAHFESPPGADCLCLHDLAVSAAAAGQGLGPLLVSVQGLQGFWRRMAYQAQVLDDPQQQAPLASYPGSGVYMTQVFAIK